MNIRISYDGNENDIEDIHERLKAYNRKNRESTKDVPIGIYYEDEHGEKLAGLTGEIFGNWLCIKYLYVDEKIRRQGIGTRLISKAEKEAKSHGCKYAFVDTFSFQAPDFYKKLGYKEVFILTDYPLTSKRYYFTKEL